MGIVMGVWLALVTAIAMIAIHMAAMDRERLKANPVSQITKLVLAVFLLVGVAHIYHGPVNTTGLFYVYPIRRRSIH